MILFGTLPQFNYTASHNYLLPLAPNCKTSANVDQFSYFFTVKFRKNLRRKPELKLSPPLKSVVTLPCVKSTL